MRTLKLLFTSDEHGHIRKAPRVQNLINKAKAENPNTLLVSSGDIFQGTPESDLFNGKPSLDVIKEAGYDLIELGNHDFDNGVPFVKEWLKKADYPILAGNVIEESTGERLPGAEAYKVFEMGDVKLGLIGVVTPETKTASFKENVEGLEFLEPAPVVEQAKKELEAQGVNLIGVISHLGLGEDKKLAADVDGIDFILGGHSHLALEEPRIVGDTLICQPGSFRDHLGSLEISLDKERGTIVSFEHQLISVAEGEEEQTSVLDTVQKVTKKLDEANDTIVTQAKFDLRHDHRKENSLGYVASESMREATGAPIALLNLKSQRADISRGDVTAGDIYKAFPFPNKVVKARVRRSDLLKAIALSEERKDHRSLTRHHMKIEFESGSQGTPNCRIKDCILKDDPNPESEFVEIATNDYLAQGGLGYFKDAEVISEHGFQRDVLEDYLDKHIEPAHSDYQKAELSSKEIFKNLSY